MIAGLELTTITAQFQGQTVNAAQATVQPSGCSGEAMIDLQLNPQDCPLILRRSMNNELTAEVDPSPRLISRRSPPPACMCRAVWSTTATTSPTTVTRWVAIWCRPPRPTALLPTWPPSSSADPLIKRPSRTIYALIDRSQLDAAIDYQNAEVAESSRTRGPSGLMLNVAIRFMMEMADQLPLPVPDRFQRLLPAAGGA